jgi:broad specificity phosphatase PhoE
MLFYFVRHGQTDANRAGLLAGSGIDHPLNDEGHSQAKALAAVIRSHIPHPLHRLIASNMKRAQQTASYLANELNLPIELNPHFREWHLGEWEGCKFEEYGHLLLGEGEPKTGESRKTFYTRIENAWKSIHCDQQPYLVVAHGAVWLAMQDLLQIPRFKADNCNLMKVESRDNFWRARILA